MTWVLLHELIHIRRRDAWVALMQRLVQIVYFFHPAVWAANRMIDVFREYACDDAATAIAGVPRYDCGAGFLSIVERVNVSAASNGPALGMLDSKTLIRSRLMRILDGGRSLRSRLSWGSRAFLVAVATVALPRIYAQDESAKPAPPPVRREVAPARDADAANPVAQEKLETEPKPKSDAERKVAKIVSGVVRDGKGRPVAGVMITGSDRHREVRFTNGALEDFAKHDWMYAESGADGRYRFEGPSMARKEPPITEFGIFAYHESGYARRSAGELADSGDITLEPWGRVEGSVIVLGKPLAGVPIRFTLDATDVHSMFYDFFEYDAKADDQGRFVIEHVPAGIARASTGSRFSKESGPYGIVASAPRRIKSGETLKLNIGGVGRPVVGKLRMLEGIPVSLGGGRLVLKSGVRPEPPLAFLKADDISEDAHNRVFLHNFNAYRSSEGRERRLARRIHSVQILPNGSFRAVEVEPGAYTLSFWAGEDYANPLETREIVVPEIPGQRWTDEPFDLGTVTIKPPESK